MSCKDEPEAGQQSNNGGAPSRLTRVRRYPDRGRYDRPAIDAILDAGLMCHLGFVWEDRPVVLPTIYWRDGDRVYWHGSAASRMLRAVEGAEVCLTVSHLDGLVLTRSAFNHSANYRSVALFGRATLLDDPAECLAQMQRMMDSMFPGRWAGLRPIRPRELAATRILSLPIAEASAKIRQGPALDDAEDLDWPAWCGVIPLAVQDGAPIADAGGAGAGLTPPQPARPRIVRPPFQETCP